MATETAHLYLVNIGSPNSNSSADATSWSLLLIDKLHPEKATLHSLGASRTQISEARRLRNSFLYNRTGSSLTRNDVQMLLSSPMVINLVKYAGIGMAKAGGTESSPSALLESLIIRGLPLSSLLPPPPADSFDSFDPDFDSKRGILSPGSGLLSYCHVGSFSQECDRLAFESFRQCLSNAMFAVLDRPSYYSRGAGAIDKDFELWATQEWAVRAISGVRNSFKFGLSSDIPSLVDGFAPVKEHIGKVLDACKTGLE
jgi:hypothetical protein